jgi:aldose 1-epimerase
MTETLRAGPARVTIDPDDGGRLSSLVVAGRELLYSAGTAPTMHGSFVMAPYAGRIRDGRFTHSGHEVSLPLTLPPHGAHGLVLDRPWTLLDRSGTTATLACDLDERWPFGGRVVQRVSLEPHRLSQQIQVEAQQQPFPASAGWHPWFARRLERTPPAQVRLSAGAMLLRDADYVTTSRRVPPTPGPWDDCFVDVDWPVTLTWPGAMRLDIEADTPCVVVFDNGDVSVCVEPQTHPPDALNSGATLVRPGHPVTARTDWAWTLL